MAGSFPLSGPRAPIMRLVRKGDGSTFAEVRAVTELGQTAVLYHVARLEKQGFLRLHRHARTVYLFPAGLSEDEARRRAEWKHDAALRFIVGRLESGRVSRRALERELQSVLGLSRQGGWQAVQRAIAMGWIRQKTGRLSVVRPAPTPAHARG